MSEIEEYRSENFTIVSDGKRCIHSRFCVLNLPQVFIPNADGPWIRPDAAPQETAIAVIEKCPSGALNYRSDGDLASEQPPGVNTVRIWENGPLAFQADIDIAGDRASYRAVLCRCGMSKNKPFCDHSHVDAKFVATGEPESKEVKTLDVKNGPLKVSPTKDGPLKVEGALEICAASGKTISREKQTFLCRCGHSSDKPFCDGSHKSAGFKANAGMG